MGLKLNQKELDKLVETKVGDEVKNQVKSQVKTLIDEQEDGFIKAQVQDEITKALAKMAEQTPEEKAVEEAKKEGGKEFKSFGEFLTSIYTARHFSKLDDRLVYVDSQGKISKPEVSDLEAEKKAMTEGVDSAGGFLVFQEFMPKILQIALEGAIVRNNGPMVIPMKSDTLNIPRIDETSHTEHIRGGVRFDWTAEEKEKSEVQPAFGNTKLTAHEGAGFTVVSNALLADSAIALAPFIQTCFGEAKQFYEDVAFINGSGVGQPLGFLNSNALIAVTRQAVGAVRWGDIANIWAQVLPPSRKRGIWILNHEVLPEFIKMVAENAAPAATAGHVIWVNPNQGAAGQIPGTIMGRPYFESEKVPALGSAYDLGFYDLGFYIIGDRQTLTIDASTHVYFTSNRTAWRFVIRVDGRPWIENKLTPMNGTKKLSPFVALGATS